MPCTYVAMYVCTYPHGFSPLPRTTHNTTQHKPARHRLPPLRLIGLFCTLPGTYARFLPAAACTVAFQEKTALAKELNDKSTVLAGVRDKTKAYVEKLNKEKAAAVAALEDQVR